MDPSDADPLILETISAINWKEFACGWSAAFINITITYPINKIIFRQVIYCFYGKNLIVTL